MRSRSQPPPKFFLDRGLGVYSIAEALIQEGIEIQTLRERYGEVEGQKIKDEKWIREATLDGYILLHKDKRVRRRPNEKRALIESESRSFALSSGNLSGAEATARYLRNWPRILRAIRRRPAPFFYVVLEHGIELRRLDRNSLGLALLLSRTERMRKAATKTGTSRRFFHTPSLRSGR